MEIIAEELPVIYPIIPVALHAESNNVGGIELTALAGVAPYIEEVYIKVGSTGNCVEIVPNIGKYNPTFR